MASETRMFTFERVVAAPAAEVYRAFTHPVALREWLCGTAYVEPQVGGRLALWWNSGYLATGTYTFLEPGVEIDFTWQGQGEPAPTQVQVALAPHAGGTAVLLTHTGIGSGDEWNEPARQIERGWLEGMEHLQSLLETGNDLRLERTPMIGLVDAEDLDAERAARLGVPVSAGIVLGGLVEGKGLQNAGLRKDDVIISIAGWPTATGEALGSAIRGHRAGDRVEISFYRGADPHTVTVELSSRPPLPTAPSTVAELVAAAREFYARFDEELAARFAGVSEAAAGHKPTPGEWSAKETIAHFIACERDLQSWIAGMLLDQAVADSLEYRTNVLPRLAALVAVYVSTPALLEELKRAEAETIALLAALPPEFVARAHMYQRVGRWVLWVVPFHTRVHLEQIDALLGAAEA